MNKPMTDTQLLNFAALAMRRQADAVLDKEEGWAEWAAIPHTWAYSMLATAGWLETERDTLNLRTRPYAVAIATAFLGEAANTP